MLKKLKFAVGIALIVFVLVVGNIIAFGMFVQEEHEKNDDAPAQSVTKPIQVPLEVVEPPQQSEKKTIEKRKPAQTSERKSKVTKDKKQNTSPPPTPPPRRRRRTRAS
ncbi:hypothetical protein D6817_00630 [Candidatus Pacearchaeota archaeon]|nr:MAG: hypothetical protein D6817_00630 [Candidatus Pacearchaeota archaeon]